MNLAPPVPSVRRLLAMLAIAALLAALLVGLDSPRPALAHPEACETKSAQDAEGAHGDECLSEDETAAFDDSGATLASGDVSSSRNLQHIANLPKSGPFAGTSNFGSDLAFQGNYAYQGNYGGIQVTDISNPSNPRVVSQIDCPGPQNDVSVYGDLLFASVDSSRNKAECEGNVFQTATNPDSWEGIRIFDISNPAAPSYVTAVETDCGSHTHTLLPDLANERVLLYVSSYSPNANFPDCQPPHDKISVVEVPLAAPASASVINEPVLFPDGGTPSGTGRATDGCHDITVYPALKLAAGACTGQGSILDISDPVNPQEIARVSDPNFAFWHSATFSNDGKKVIFTDELGGGGQATCNPTIGAERGADAIYDISNPQQPVFQSYFKIARTQSNTENCVAHNGNVLPVAGRDLFVQSWYQGGTSIIDFTDAKKPVEIAHFERGPISDEKLVLGGTWSSYFYNGFIYSNDIQEGLDVLKFSDKRAATAGSRKLVRLNAQTQEPLG
jgi:hypothetical protein